jgi:hypothetical protein
MSDRDQLRTALDALAEDPAKGRKAVEQLFAAVRLDGLGG